MIKKNLFIFEGPDGVGKTTLAKALAHDIGAEYVHHGPYRDVTDGDELMAIYAKSMHPAIRRERHVVLDRSWLSEVPYGLAYRNGLDRLGDGRRLELEMDAVTQTHPLVIRCAAPFDQIVKGFLERADVEYLDNEKQLHQVWRWFENEFDTHLEAITISPLGLPTSHNVEHITWYMQTQVNA